MIVCAPGCTDGVYVTAHDPLAPDETSVHRGAGENEPFPVFEKLTSPRGEFRLPWAVSETIALQVTLLPIGAGCGMQMTADAVACGPELPQPAAIALTPTTAIAAAILRPNLGHTRIGLV